MSIVPKSPAARSLQVTRVPIESLVPDPANARAHPEPNLQAILASLRRFGQAEPLVVQASSRRVIAGHGRLLAMKTLGWPECDVVEIDVDDVTATALGIALNRTAELAEWDEPVLARLLDQLRAQDALDGVGYSSTEIDALLAEMGGGPVSPTEVDDPGPEEPPEKPVTQPGDLWVLGNHRLLCGDSTKAEDIARVLAGQKASLLATDPPYCVGYTGNDRPDTADGKPGGKDWSHVYREIDIPDYPTFLDGFLTAALPHTTDDAPIYVWHAHTQQHVVVQVFEKHDLLFHQVIVWVKPTPVFTHCFFQWQHEPCAFGWKRGNKPTHGIAQHSTIWNVDWEGKARVVGNAHPTQKPLRLFELPMELHTQPGGIVLEPFSGSGSQIIAAERIGRRCRAVEIAPAFVDVAIRRWEQATGQEAVLDGTTKTFAQLRAERGGAA